jgi:hypothetical protein
VAQVEGREVGSDRRRGAAVDVSAAAAGRARDDFQSPRVSFKTGGSREGEDGLEHCSTRSSSDGAQPRALCSLREAHEGGRRWRGQDSVRRTLGPRCRSNDARKRSLQLADGPTPVCCRGVGGRDARQLECVAGELQQLLRQAECAKASSLVRTSTSSSAAAPSLFLLVFIIRRPVAARSSSSGSLSPAATASCSSSTTRPNDRRSSQQCSGNRSSAAPDCGSQDRSAVGTSRHCRRRKRLLLSHRLLL